MHAMLHDSRRAADVRMIRASRNLNVNYLRQQGGGYVIVLFVMLSLIQSFWKQDN